MTSELQLLALCTDYAPPEKRKRYAEGGVERRLTEAAVMLAIAHYLFSQGAHEVTVCPDGEHAKRFDIVAWLERHGYGAERRGRTAYGGVYTRGESKLIVHPKSGMGDVTAVINDRRVFVECKGGTINSKHSGRLSQLRKGLLEAVGALLIVPEDGSRQIAAVPRTALTLNMAAKLATRCHQAGIEIALVHEDGLVTIR